MHKRKVIGMKVFYDLSRVYGLEEKTIRSLVLKNPKLAQYVIFRPKGSFIYRYMDEQGEHLLSLYSKGANLNEICR